MIVLRVKEILEYKQYVTKYKVLLESIEPCDHTQLTLDLYSTNNIKELNLEVGCEYELNLKKVEDD